MMKTKMINQLTLGVGLKDEATFANFYSENNIQLVNALKSTAHGKGEKIIYFYGAFGGQGCTHLLQASCHEAHQNQRSSVYIPLAKKNDFSPEIFEGLESLQLVCIDDVHCIAGNPIWEEALFHMYNRINDVGSRLIVTANVAPKSLGLVLPDVVSRLAWGMIFQLQSLSDSEKLFILMMR